LHEQTNDSRVTAATNDNVFILFNILLLINKFYVKLSIG
jgi:hypothetical protein